MQSSLNLIERGGVAEIVLDAPNRNSLDRLGLEELHSILVSILERDSARAVIISGANGDFCGGRVPKAGLLTAKEIREDLAPILALNQLLDKYPVPLIAAVEGVALGFGFGLATLCDLTFVGEDVGFALTEFAHGIPPLIVLSYLYRFVPYKVAFELALTGREVGAEEAYRLGIATAVLPAGSALTKSRELAGRIAEFKPEGVMLLRSFARSNASLHDDSAASVAADRIAEFLASRSERQHH